MKHILVTGGSGYIGSHTVVELLNSGYLVTVADSLINSKQESLRRCEEITGQKIPFVKVDICDTLAVENLFSSNHFDGVIHFAGLKAVGESVEKPILYYRNNLNSTINILEAMKNHNVNQLVFSSSATVYGDPAKVPITEDMPLSPTNPYGQTKLMCERIITDFAKSNSSFKATLLRYFNPIGAHKSGLIGEDPYDIPNNLVPYIAQVAAGKLECLNVFGDDYETPDGTGVRDYIHVVDLAKGHLSALEKHVNGISIYNLGTGKGYSVLEVIKAFEQACKKTIPFNVTARRPGDIAVCYADPSKARLDLNWKAEKSLNEMCQDTWRWQNINPEGFN